MIWPNWPGCARWSLPDGHVVQLAATADARLRAGAAMTFHQRLQWNARMVALWRRWHPRLAERVARERVPLR